MPPPELREPAMTEPQSALRSVRRLMLLAGAAALVVVLAGLVQMLMARTAASVPTGDPAVLTALQSIALDAAAAGAGDEAAIAAVEKQALTLRELAAREPGSEWARDEGLAKLLGSADAVVAARAPLVNAADAVSSADRLMPRFLKETEALNASAPEAAARALERLASRAQRVQLDLAALASGRAADAGTARRLAEDSDYIRRLIQGLQGNDAGMGVPRLTAAAAETLQSLAALHEELSGVVRRAVTAAPALPAAQSAARALGREARAFASARSGRTGAVRAALPWWAIAFGLLALVPLTLMFRRFRELEDDAARQRAAVESQRSETDRNQQAILRLLDELSSLADGDLTVQATVTEDITGAIADSINFAIEALRGLVATINHSAIQLESATRQTQALAQHLARASGAQSKQIGSASESIAAMASTTEEVSGNAERASDVARHSVDVAHKGGDAVRRTIDGMNAIRETIQETSKRIKRLGESSQEIGNIVELINDIAEQTNILALNASIQASMAGDAGRGFAVVADEVQRLAERAANATKQIEVLVRTIQTDTNEAVVSMERSTTDVVGGALLAENAGAALEEIEQVSNQIASLVQNISASSRQQAAAAQNIARNMQALRDISSQTADSTSTTSQAIAKLADLSAGLRRSVAGFRLPGAPPPQAPAAAGQQPPSDTSDRLRQVSAAGRS
ncbi:MAG: methyl-accepting chemotaxis protein [Gammaproteobacteria bacterium]|nr:methyl-accepting chemotaxis protein [Gammaproteobacteria bacterium]